MLSSVVCWSKCIVQIKGFANIGHGSHAGIWTQVQEDQTDY